MFLYSISYLYCTSDFDPYLRVLALLVILLRPLQIFA